MKLFMRSNAIIHKLIKFIKDDRFRFAVLDKYHLFNFIPDEKYIAQKFYSVFGYTIDLSNPKTFNEKLQWLKIYDRKPLYTTLVDKYLVKDYVANIIGEEHVIPTLGVWDDPSDIDFDSLPNQFVLKCNHNSGLGMYICKDKSEMDKDKVIRDLRCGLKEDYYHTLREWPYKDVKRKIIAEKYMEDSSTREQAYVNNGLDDYKIHSFWGVPKVILVCKDRFAKSGLKEDFFDTKWNHMDVSRSDAGNVGVVIPKPDELEEMLYYSSVLSKNIPFLRVDFYVVNHKVYFGEMTFFPAGGFKRFIPDRFDEEMGDWLELPCSQAQSMK